MPHKQKNDKKSYVLNAEPGKIRITLLPVTLITEKIKILKHPKNMALSVLVSLICSLVGFILGGIIGTILGFIVSVVFLFIIGPTKEKVIERNKEKTS